MKVLIDARSMSDKQTGITRYSEQLIESYNKHWGAENVSIITNNKVSSNQKNIIKTNLQKHSIWDSIKIYFLIKKMEFDIFHASDLTGPLIKQKNKYYILTVHDLMYKVVSDFFNVNKFYNIYVNLKLDFLHRCIFNNSDWIISVSKTTKNDLIKYFGYDSTVYSEGINKIDNNSTNSPKIDTQLRKNSFFLYTGVTSKHKNITFLIDAYIKANTDKKLVICGKNTNNIYSENGNVIFTGWVSDEQLKYYYENCAAYIFPSLYEGFGLPILEALSLGAKVFSSNAGSLGEFSNEVISFFSPYDSKSLIELIEKVDDIKFDEERVGEYLKSFEWNEIFNGFHKELKERINAER